MENIGCMIAQRLVGALTGNGIDYKTLCNIVYGEMNAIAAEQVNGDWIEMPTGDTYTKTFTVTKPAT